MTTDPLAADLVICHCQMCQGRGCKPMATDPSAVDLGAIRGRLEYLAGNGDGDRVRVTPADLRTLLDTYDAQAARLAELEQHQCPQYRQHHQSRLVQLRRTMAERDEYKRERDDFEHVLQDTEDLVDAAEQRVARLATLEDAARAFVHDPMTMSCYDDLLEAVANLDAPPVGQ